jgi:single-stranded DNA-specific DHH superfamily exonuclease
MSSKAPTAGARTRAPEPPDGAGRAQLRRELERRGVAGEVAERLAGDLAARCASLTPEARRGALTGMALASAVHQEHAEALLRSQRDLADIERMMAGFALELKKVDEAVKILSTFVGRIREQSAPDPNRVVH